MVVIDDGPIRRRAVEDCRAALKQRKKARAEWERFQREDQPAFERWMHRVFAAEMSKLREIREKTAEAEGVVRAVELEAMRSRVSYAEAYDRVMRERENPEEARSAEEDGGAEGEEDFGDPFGEGNPFESEEDLKEVFREMFGMDEEEAEEAFARMTGRRNVARPPEREASGRIKEVYRSLVRRLHPDAGGEVDAGKRDLWHAVQAAYRARDLAQLESLLARCDLEEGVVGEHTPVSQLRKVWREIRKSVNSLRAEIRRAKKDVAWGFSRWTRAQEARNRAAIGRELRAGLEESAYFYRELRSQIDVWEKKRRRGEERRAAKAEAVTADPERGRAGKRRRRREPLAEDGFQGEFSF